ncbi:MAG: hypothetical protein ACE5GJ_05445 [Gemmatimonadota bacterium]
MILRRLHTRTALRRGFAAAVLCASVAAGAEATTAGLRDGWTHREVAKQVLQAGEMQDACPLDHHLAASPSSSHQDEDHGHLDGFDHCSHAHGYAVLSGVSWPTAEEAVSVGEAATFIPNTVQPLPIRHPPRA